MATTTKRDNSHGASSGLKIASSPADQTLAIIRRTWAELLGVARVAPDDDFFEIGGHSLMVASAVARLGKRVGLDLPLRALFEAPTPIEMAELIEELRGARGDGTTPFFPDWLVPLQRQGNERPVFVFPGGMGGKWILLRDAQVAALVGRDHPFYGFQRDRPHLPLDRVDWIPAMAAAYVEQIQAVQPHGPYLLFGVCNGGALAWDVARQLLAAGAEIAAILLYEVALAPEVASPGAHQITPPARPGRMPPYVPQLLPVDLTLLMTEAWQAKGYSDGWRHVTGGRLETVVMPGDTPGAHNLYAGREAMIAGHVRDWIARAEARRLPV